MGIAIGSHGTVITIGAAGGGGPFTAISEQADIGGPSMTRATHEAPRQTSEWIQKIAGMINGGSMTLNINYVPGDATHVALLDAFSDGLLRDLVFTFPEASFWTVPTIVTEFPVDAPVDGVLTTAVTFEVVDEITF